ncbi:alkaline phosphatase D family protein [Actinocatenispora rupis]|uniref:Alkaline phosphatase n=1 Tax=Actinocatenispora rupis TaxID=519421 RepID=A0A8J3J660_9ACTN|nr:alkaline phosphatase D family protein [Actinocatenispora rupis]GID14843.1 alkaline phosphatase [Actinocatenispora rupis]
MPRSPLSRRRLFVLGAGIAGAGLLAASRLPADRAAAAPALPGHPFTLGVASGDPRPDGVVLWTRLAPVPLAEDGFGGMPRRAVPVRWEVAEDESMRRIVAQGTAVAQPDLAHSVHVEVDGLRPGRDYWYRFGTGTDESPVGRTRTAPGATDPTPVTFAFVSCQQWDAGFYTAYRDLAAQYVDVVHHLGDWIYENPIAATGGKRNLATPLPAVHNQTTMTLTQYRLRHALVASDPDFVAARASAPFVATVDDHDVEDNWAGVTSPMGTTPEDFLRRRAAAFRAYYEHVPLRPSSLPTGPDMRLYRALPYGRLATFFVLDERQYRSPENIGKRDDPGRTMLGDAQERWLLDALAGSGATWQLMANQTMMFQLDRLTDPGLQQLNPDSWDGYAAARGRLFAGLAERKVRNPVVLSGDAHVHCAADLKADFADPDSATIGAEFLGTSISSGGDGSDLTAAGKEWLAANPHLRFVNSQRGYVRCRVEPAQFRADYVVLDKVTTPGGTASVRRSFVVESGRPGIQEA